MKGNCNYVVLAVVFAITAIMVGISMNKNLINGDYVVLAVSAVITVIVVKILLNKNPKLKSVQKHKTAIGRLPR